MTTWTVRRQCHEQLLKDIVDATKGTAPTTALQGMSLSATAGVGHSCPRARIMLKGTIGTSTTASVWLFDPTSEQWVLDTSLGTAGVVTVTNATNGGTVTLLVDTRGFSRIFLQSVTFVGANQVINGWATGLTTP